MENTEIINKVIENAKDAYSFAKEIGFAEPLVNTAKSFINWFGSLFSREPHKKKLILLETQQAMENDISALSVELSTQLEENDKLKAEFEQKVTELEKAKANEPNQTSVQIIHSKNVLVNVQKIVVKGDFRVGDNIKVEKKEIN